MMQRPIALVTRLAVQEEQDWLDRLAVQMPAERILPFSAMTDADRQAAEIAIVANPDPAQVAALPRLAWINSLWAGVERLVAELRADAPPIVRLIDPELSRTMAEAVLAWCYYLHRDMPAYRRHQQAKLWQPLPYRPPSQVQVGLLGLGALGQAAAQRLLDAGFQVTGWSRSAKPADLFHTHAGEDGLTTVLQTSDIIVCLVPLTPDTRDLIDAQRLEKVKNGAALINFARGPVVNSTALRAALDRGRLSHAVLDVFDQEPLPATSPLWDHPGVTVLPHISAPTSADSAAAIVAANIAAYRADGRLPPTVDRQRGY